MRLKSDLFSKNIGAKQEGKEVPTSIQKPKDDKMPVSPFMLGVFLFLVIGSALFQILQTSQNPGMVE